MSNYQYMQMYSGHCNKNAIQVTMYAHGTLSLALCNSRLKMTVGPWAPVLSILIVSLAGHIA